jgi:hypothetical protein
LRFLTVTVIAAAVLAAAGLALAQTPSHQAAIDSTVRFLQESQRADGGFADPGQQPNQDISAWVAPALSSTGINPQDQARCGTDAFTFLTLHFHEGVDEELAGPAIATTAFERELLAVDAAGADPRDFAGYDLVEEILRRQLPDGSFPYVPEGTRGESNDTIFAILGLSPIDEPTVETATRQAAEWVVAAQDEDGGWYYSGKRPSSEVDMTGAALEALVAAGPPSGAEELAADEESIAKGLEYLRRSQLADGGFPALPGERESNVASTAWAVQGIWATGGNPEEWKVGSAGREPLDYMESMQQPDGHIRWRASNDVNGIWMTAYVTPAFAGQALPVPAAARFNPLASHGEAVDCDGAGQGGEAPQAEEKGVLTDGGGRGAPSFSRPQAQSKGKTPGGARVVRGEGLRARDHSDRRRGANLHQARGTEKREPAPTAAADQEVKAVSGEATTAATASAAGKGGGGGEGDGPGGRGKPLPVGGSPHRAAATGGEEVSGVVIGSPQGTAGKLAFGAPGLRSAGAGSGSGDRPAILIGVGTLVAALLGAGLERRGGAAV